MMHEEQKHEKLSRRPDNEKINTEQKRVIRKSENIWENSFDEQT